MSKASDHPDPGYAELRKQADAVYAENAKVVADRQAAKDKAKQRADADKGKK